MKSSKIDRVSFNNRRKTIEISSGKRQLELPYSKLTLKPSSENPIQEIFVDKELARKAVTYRLKSGQEDSLPLDAFLDFNRDSDYLREIELYNLTLKALELFEKSKLPKRAICRRMGTSLSQLSRLFDTTNYQKSIDQMFRLVTALGGEVEIKVA